MYVTLNRANGKIWLTFYEGNCGYFIEDTQESQEILKFPSHMKYKNKVNLDDDFMKNLWRIVEGTPGRIRLITNALVDVKTSGDEARKFVRRLEETISNSVSVQFEQVGHEFICEVRGSLGLINETRITSRLIDTFKEEV